jgi:DNA-directed RNA polymerase subunit M/transcription elongation factor TFIIS
MVVSYECGQDGGEKTWPQASVPGAEHYGSAEHCDAENQREKRAVNEQRIHQQMESERHDDARYGETVAQQQRRVAYRVRFAFCSDTHNLWLLCQGRGSGSADGQLVILTGGPRLAPLRLAYPVGSVPPSRM